MSDLLEWKERVRHFYGKYEVLQTLEELQCHLLNI